MFSLAVVVAALASLATASPALPLESRALPSGDVTCGSNVYTVSQVSAAVSAGYSHVGSPLGSNSYPHAYYSYADEHITLYCSGSSWYEYPILKSGLYSGGSPGADRVIFNTGGTYCAVVTHTDAGGDDAFTSCKND
ncbi:guanyl-specific ribonuclease T1 precursor [Peniophora sp. CONT]|nr:guanyl-specific ribonuclease T1 precursor [Peniophora sp. CONT]